jgi:hypothetical protein
MEEHAQIKHVMISMSRMPTDVRLMASAKEPDLPTPKPAVRHGLGISMDRRVHGLK